jgi:lysozyme
MANLDAAISLCKQFEGFRSHPYLCPANVWTIGYGTTFYPGGRRVKQTDPAISVGKAEDMLLFELNSQCLPAVLRLCPVLAEHENKLNAVVDFVFNLGAGRLQNSTLRRKINIKDWSGAKAELARWVYGGGKVLPGLVKRRAAEAALFE